MTALATVPAQGQEVAQFAAPVLDYQTRAVQRFVEWVSAADTAFAIAERITQTAFCPVQYRGKPMEAMAAMLAGAEVGLSPMASLRAFDNIQGTATAKAITLRAIVQSHGHEIEQVESTRSRCRMRGRRRGAQTWQETSWTFEQAQELGLAGKDNWKKQPKAMLIARATSELCRLIASDAILGIPYSSEEIADGVNPDQDEPEVETEHAEEQPKTRTLSRGRSRAGRAREVSEPPAPATRHEFGLLNRAFERAGVTTKDAMLQVAREVAGREVASATDLTADEVHAVIAKLSQPDDTLPVQDPADYDPTAEQGWGAQGGEER